MALMASDTDGHIDDLTRFVNDDTVVTVVEHDKNDENYAPLKANLELLHTLRLENGKQLNIAELPMPAPVIYEDQRLPASYANFYIANQYVIVPTFCDSKNDDKAIDILQSCFPERKSKCGLKPCQHDLVWGTGDIPSASKPTGAFPIIMRTAPLFLTQYFYPLPV